MSWSGLKYELTYWISIALEMMWKLFVYIRWILSRHFQVHKEFPSSSSSDSTQCPLKYCSTEFLVEIQNLWQIQSTMCDGSFPCAIINMNVWANSPSGHSHLLLANDQRNVTVSSDTSLPRIWRQTSWSKWKSFKKWADVRYSCFCHSQRTIKDDSKHASTKRSKISSALLYMHCTVPEGVKCIFLPDDGILTKTLIYLAYSNSES